MTAAEQNAIDKLEGKIEDLTESINGVLRECAQCRPSVNTLVRLMFEDSGRAPSAGVAKAGIVAEHRDLMATFDSSRFAKRSFLSAFLSEAGRWAAAAVVLGIALALQSRFLVPLEPSNGAAPAHHERMEGK